MEPQSDEQVAIIQRESTALVSDLTRMFPRTEITDTTELEQASAALATITKRQKEWEAKRQSIVKPANDFVRSINDLWKRITAPVETEGLRIRTMMSAYRGKEQAQRQAEYMANLEKSKEIFKDGSPIPEIVAPIPQESVKKIETESGWVGFATVWKWAIEDESKVPAEYWELNTAKITKVVKAGIREIPGVRIYAEQVPTVRTS